MRYRVASSRTVSRTFVFLIIVNQTEGLLNCSTTGSKGVYNIISNGASTILGALTDIMNAM
jgi:hypothetical protein